MKNILGTVIDSLAARRAAAAEAHRLELELAGFTTEADMLELDSILDRYSDEQTSHIRDIVGRRRGAQYAA